MEWYFFLRVESGEWRVESGEWRVESGERRVESEKREEVSWSSLAGDVLGMELV